MIRAGENVPCPVRYSEAARHDRMFLEHAMEQPQGSVITFDRGYGDYHAMTDRGIWYVTRLKDNALYRAGKEFDIPDGADSGFLKDEEIVLFHGSAKQ